MNKRTMLPILAVATLIAVILPYLSFGFLTAHGAGDVTFDLSLWALLTGGMAYVAVLLAEKTRRIVFIALVSIAGLYVLLCVKTVLMREGFSVGRSLAQFTRTKAAATYGKSQYHSWILFFNPADVRAYQERGGQKLLAGDLHAALSDFSAILRVDPGNKNAFILRANVYTAMKQFDSGIEDASRAIAIAPQDYQGYLLRAQCYLLKKDVAKAQEDLAVATQVAPNHAVAYYQCGDLYVRCRNDKEAEALFSRAIKSDAKFVPAYRARADIYARRGDHQKAWNDINTTVSLAPNDPSEYFARAYAYMMLEKYREAVADFSQALRLQPTNVSALGHKAYCLKKQHDYEAADQAYAAVLKLNSGNRTEVCMERGKLHALLNRKAQALEYFEGVLAASNRALKAHPGDATYLVDRGWVYLWMEKWEDARADFERAKRINPALALADENLANYWWAHKRDADKALDALESAFRIGFKLFDNLTDEMEDGYFLKGLNETPRFKALVNKYRNPARPVSPSQQG